MPQPFHFSIESPSNEHRTAAESASAETGAGGGGGTGNGGASSLLLPLEPAGWRNGARCVEVKGGHIFRNDTRWATLEGKNI